MSCCKHHHVQADTRTVQAGLKDKCSLRMSFLVFPCTFTNYMAGSVVRWPCNAVIALCVEARCMKGAIDGSSMLVHHITQAKSVTSPEPACYRCITCKFSCSHKEANEILAASLSHCYVTIALSVASHSTAKSTSY